MLPFCTCCTSFFSVTPICPPSLLCLLFTPVIVQFLLHIFISLSCILCSPLSLSAPFISPFDLSIFLFNSSAFFFSRNPLFHTFTFLVPPHAFYVAHLHYLHLLFSPSTFYFPHKLLCPLLSTVILFSHLNIVIFSLVHLIFSLSTFCSFPVCP